MVFGFIYWLLDGMMDIFVRTGVADTTTFTVYPLLMFVWAGIVVVYLVFGGIWLVRSFQQQTMIGGYR